MDMLAESRFAICSVQKANPSYCPPLRRRKLHCSGRRALVNRTSIAISMRPLNLTLHHSRSAQCTPVLEPCALYTYSRHSTSIIERLADICTSRKLLTSEKSAAATTLQSS